MADEQAGQIEVLNPQGQAGNIPLEQMDDALSQGYKLSKHILMYDPQGRRGLVPKEQGADAMKAGYRTTPETGFEKQNKVPGRLEAGNEVAGKLLGATGLLPTSIKDIPRWGRYMVGQEPGQKPFWESFKEAASNPTERNLVGAVPIIGPTSVAMADEPTLLGKAATLTGAGLGVEAGRQTGPGLRAGRAELAELTRTPENKLTPVTRQIARAAGGLAGHSLLPGGGTVAGYLAGPTIADAVLPERAAVPDFRGGAYNEFAGESGKAVPIRQSPFFNPEEYQAGRRAAFAKQEPPTYPGASLPSADEFYERRGADLMRRGIQEDRLARTAAAAEPKGIVSPGLPEPRVSGSEGRPATWTNERVLQLARQGNREAIAQAVRRGMELPENTRYVMGDPDYPRAVYNPKEATRSTPEDMPIRNAANPNVKSARGRIQVPPLGAVPREVINAATGEVTNPRMALPEEVIPQGQPLPSGLGERRSGNGQPPLGIKERRGVYEIHKANIGPTEGEKLAQELRTARAGPSGKVTEGEALRRIMKDPDEYEKYKAADQKTRDRMLVEAARRNQ